MMLTEADGAVTSYIDSVGKRHRKSHGIYYTDRAICEYLIDHFVEITGQTRVVEPGCGCGYFALELFRKFKEMLPSISPESILKRNLVLIDNDTNALKVLSRLLDVDISNFLNGSFLLDQRFQPASFDYVIGNPPYAAKLTDEEKRYCSRIFPEFSESTKRFESSANFIKLGIDLLRPGGTLVFVVPSTILRIHSYEPLRQYVKKECFVRGILDIRRAFDDVGYETTIVILDKKDSNAAAKPTFLKTKTGINGFDLSTGTDHECNYRFFESMRIFPLFIGKRDLSIITQIEQNTVRLREIASMPRGAHIDISNENISDTQKAGYIPILFGRGIGKYKIYAPQKYIRWPFEGFWELRQKHLQDKLLVQNLAYKIVAAYDSNGHFVNDTINTVFIKDKDFPPLYILGILNSNLINYYFQNTITNRARLNIHLDHYYLGEIPIRRAAVNDKASLIEVVEQFLRQPLSENRKEIERAVYRIYGIKEEEIDYIETAAMKGKKNT